MRPSKDYNLPKPLKVTGEAAMKVVRGINKFFSFTPVKIILLVLTWFWFSPLMLAVDRDNKILKRKTIHWLIFFSSFSIYLLFGLFLLLVAILMILFPGVFVEAYTGLV